MLNGDSRTESGSVLLVAIMMILFTSALILSIFNFMSRSSGEDINSKLTTARTALALQLKREVRIGGNIYASMALPENAALIKCVVWDANQGDAPDQCKSGNLEIGPWTPIRMIGSDGSGISGNSSTSAVKYDATGSVCSKDCAFAVWSDYVSFCQAAADTSCKIARGISIRLHISPIGNGPGIKLHERIENQYVPVLDWSLGNWANIGYESDIMSEPLTSDVNQPGDPDAYIPSDAPSDSFVFSLPTGSACPAGQRTGAKGCQKFSM